jgi:hypothetical protein
MAIALRMASGQQKAACVWWMAEIKLNTNVQRKFRMAFCETPPSGESILWWMEQFKATTSIDCHQCHHERKRAFLFMV